MICLFVRWRFACLIAVFISLPLGASTNPTWFARAWQTEDGIPEHTIVGLEQAPDGYLWVATHRSLSRFDGVRFQEFTPATPGAPTTSQFRAMLLDRRGRLWLAKDIGTVLCVEAGRVTQVQALKETFPGATARVMAEDGGGGIWVGDSLGTVFRIHDGKAQAFGTTDGLAGPGTCWLATDVRGQIWFSQAGRVGVFRGGRFVTLVTLGQQSGRLASARGGGIWLCSGLKLFRYRERGELEAVAELNLEPGGGEATVTAMYEDKSHGLWIGTSSIGLFRMDRQGIQSVDTTHPNIINLCEDSEGNIWVGTRGGGLNRLSPRAVELVGPAGGLPFAAVQSACEDAGGNLWAAGQNGVLTRRIDGLWRVVSSNSGWNGGAVACVAALTGGGVLVGTRDQGVFRHQDGVFTPMALNQHLVNPHVRSLYISSNDDLWVAVNSDVIRLRHGSVKHFPLPAGASNIRTMVEDAGGDLWMGTTSDGLLLRIHEDVLINETIPILHEPKSIRCLQVTSDGSLWIGFADQGLGRFKNGRYFQFRAGHGLWHEYISQILAGNHGRLWIACNRGIFQVAQSELEAVAEGRATRVRSVVFGRGEGVPNLQATFGICPAAAQTRDGRLLMPMLTGLAIIQPSLLRQNPVPPPVIIERFTVNGRIAAAYDLSGGFSRTNEAAPVNLRAAPSVLRLGAGVNRVEIEFTGLSLASPENLTFRYQLEGLEQDWVDAGAARIARYPRMPPGNYRFRVTACNHDGIWNETGASLAFRVAAPFYRTWWFQILAALFLLGTVGGIVRYLEFRKMRRQVERAEREGAIERERARIAKDIHDDLGASLTEITLLSELAQSGEALPGEVQADMRKIAARTRQLTQAVDATVWAMNPRNDTLDSLVSYLCHHAEDYLKPAGIRCRLDVPARLPGQPLTAAVRHNVLLIVKEALHNVVKHAGASEVLLRITTREGELTLVIEDNGQGFEPDTQAEADGTPTQTITAPRRHGNGLLNMRRRAEEIDGTLELCSQPNNGTRIRLEVRFARG